MNSNNPYNNLDLHLSNEEMIKRRSADIINKGNQFSQFGFQHMTNDKYKTGESTNNNYLKEIYDSATTGTIEHHGSQQQMEPPINNLSPGYFMPEKRDDQAGVEFADALYSKSLHGVDIQSQSDASRKTFQRVNLLGKSGSRKNNLIPGQPDPNEVQLASIENFNLSNWSSDVMNKILYSLLQQIELVKYIIHEDKTDTSRKYSEAGYRIIETIMRAITTHPNNQQMFGAVAVGGKKTSMQRTRIHSIEIHSVKDIFIMVNNFALYYIKNSMNRQGFVLLQCAVQITKHYHEILEFQGLLSTLYNNLSIYHVRGRGKLSEGQSIKYVDGAIISQMKQQRQSPSAQNDINLAISLNNKAVFELKRKNNQAAQENSIKAIELLEPKLYGMLNSGLIYKPSRGSQLNEVNSHFQKILHVLLIAYYNYAASQDFKLESRNIYLKGMQLSYQYHKDGELSEMFKRFYIKYSRKHYQIIMLNKQYAQQQTQLETSARLPVPEVLPLECIIEDIKEINEGTSNDYYSKFINSLQQQQTNVYQQNQGDAVSFTVMDSARTRATHLQNQTYESHLLLPKINDSVVSMPPRGIYGDQSHQDVNRVKIQPQISELINPYDRSSDQLLYIQNTQNSINPNISSLNLHQQRTELPNFRQQSNQNLQNNNLNLQYNDSSINREIREVDAQISIPGAINIMTPPKKKEDHYSIQSSSNLGATAKFGGMSDTDYRRMTLGGLSKDPNMEYENRLQEEKLKIKEEFEMHQQDLQKKMNDQMHYMQQMMFQQQKQMTNQQFNMQPPGTPTMPYGEPQPIQNPINEILDRFSVFNWLNDQQKKFVGQNFNRMSITAGNFIFKENDIGDNFYLIESGQVEVIKKTDGNPARHVRFLPTGEHFGEQALIGNNGQRTMSVKAKTDCNLIYLTKKVFIQIYNFIDNGLKKDYNRQFENILASEKLEEQVQAMKAEKEAIEQREKELEKEQALFEKEKKKKDNDTITTKLGNQSSRDHNKNDGQKVGKLKNSSTGKLQGVQKTETQNFESTSHIQESLHRKLSKKIEENQFQDVWMTNGSKNFGNQKSNRILEGVQSAKGSNSGAPPGSSKQPVSKNEILYSNQIEVVNGTKQLSKTNLSEDNFDQKPSKMILEKTGAAMTPKHVKNNKIETYIDFHYEKLNEQDENDLGFDDLMRQHQSLINQQDGVRNSTLLNFEQLVNTYDYLEDDQIRNQFYIDNLQNQQDGNFKWSPLQIKALIYLREHHRLYSAQNIWKFNQKLLEQIMNEKAITCTKVIQQLIGHDLKQYNFKVIIKVMFSGSVDEDIEDEDDTRKYLESIASKIKIKIKAEVDKNLLLANKDVDSVTQEVELSFLELQTILYMFSDINSCDPSPSLHHLIGSIPYYHIDKFEDLCEILLFKYIDIFLSEDESIDQSRSQMSRQCPYTIDFKETPSNMLFNPIKVVFLQQENNLTNPDIDPNENQNPCNQSDNLQGQASNSDWGLSMFNNNMNCQVEVFQIKDTDFKIVISPSFDLSTIMMRMSMMQQNNGIQEVQSVQPENLCTIQIDLKFDKPDLVKFFFNSLDVKAMKFNSGTDDIQPCLQRISNSLEFYDNFLKKYVEEFDKILKQEFKEFFQRSANDANNQNGEHSGQLNNHQRFFNLVINKKVVYAQLRIEDVINAGAKQFKSRMTIGLKNFDLPQVENLKDEKPKYDLKFICLYTDLSTNGAVKTCMEPHLTSTRLMSLTFGQDIDLGYYSLQKHYNLTQICKIYMQTFVLFIDSDESEASDSGLGSSSDEFDSNSDDSDDNSGNSQEKKPAVPKEIKGKLNVYQIDSVYFQRQVKMINNNLVTLTSEILVCNLAKKILGVKFVAYDIVFKHESGVYLKIDQDMWPKREGQHVDKSKFWTNFSVVNLLKDFGIKHFMDNYLTIEAHRNSAFKNKKVLKLIEPRLNSQKSLPDMTLDLENFQNIEVEQRQRIVNQMVSDQTSISQLERFLTKKQLEEKLTN